MGGGTTKETRIYLVDLAGSERAGLYAIDAEQLKEGEHINLSLSALGRVVGALASGKCKHVPYRDSALTWLLKDAITGTGARVCMVAAVHPSHAVETSSTLRYARQYSELQTSSGGKNSELIAAVREQQRLVDRLRHDLKKSMEGDENEIAWTFESLKGTVQTARNARELVSMHPYLCWTPAHQSKYNVRGQRRDRSGIGRTRQIVTVPTFRETSEPPDGRLVFGQTKNCDDESCDAIVEVVFEGRHGRPPVTLWYPQSALEEVQPPKKLLDAVAQLEAAEEELTRKRAHLQKVQETSSKQQQEWMAKNS